MGYNPRPLDIYTLDNAAKYYAEQFTEASVPHPGGNDRYIGGHGRVVQDIYNFLFKDEFEYVVRRVLEHLDQADVEAFKRLVNSFDPRRDDVFEQLLSEHLAINPAGEHIPGVRGKTQLGNRVVGRRMLELPREKLVRAKGWRGLLGMTEKQLVEMRYVAKNEYWPVYAGEIEERELGNIGQSVDPLPEGAETWPAQQLLAVNPNISAALAIKMADLIDDEFNIGSTAATINGRTGAQPADPDASESGTLLFTLTMSTTAFGAAADDSPGALITAATITDDSSADATGTVTYCRCAATGTGADDVLDGSAGTATVDFVFNTDAIVAGAVVSMSAFTVLQPQGGTAT